jgi:hypothetical protein
MASSHLAGMSALWHDADYLPEKKIHIPTVEKGLDEMPLPSEQHQLPQELDAFAKMDEVYEVAGRQMERGIEGANFLHGKQPVNAPAETSSSKLQPKDPAEDITRTYLAQGKAQEHDPTLNKQAVQESRAVNAEIKKRDEVASQPTKTSNATEASYAKQSSKEAQKVLEMAEGVGVAMVAVAAGQAIDPASGTLAAEAASVAKAVTAAKTAVGMTRPMEEMPETARGDHLRRGLQARARRSESYGDPVSLDVDRPTHQPSLKAADDVAHQPSLHTGGEDGEK